MAIVIYDLDKTSVYCPLANFMDKFIPNNMFLKRLYYKLYPFVHTLEIRLGLLKINKAIYQRAKMYSNMPDVYQCVVTARHDTQETYRHVDFVFDDLSPDIDVHCIAQGLTNLTKAEYVKQVIKPRNDEVIIMYDDNIYELLEMKRTFNEFLGFRVLFTGNKEYIEQC